MYYLAQNRPKSVNKKLIQDQGKIRVARMLKKAILGIQYLNKIFIVLWMFTLSDAGIYIATTQQIWVCPPREC